MFQCAATQCSFRQEKLGTLGKLRTIRLVEASLLVEVQASPAQRQE
jgi:hypothetical protein